MSQIQRDFMIYAAQHDPMAMSAARLLAHKTGMSLAKATTVTAATMQLSDRMLGSQLMGAPTIAAGLAGGITSTGIMYQPTGGQASLLSGNNVASYKAAKTILDTTLRRFHDPVTGLPTRAAAGLNTAELGSVVGQMMRQGDQFAAGPMVSARVMKSQDEIDALKAKYMSAKHRDPTKLAEIKNLKVGDVFTEGVTEGMEKFEKQIGEMAKLAGSIKKVMGSQALKDLSGTMQSLFGGTAQEFGIQAARMKMAEIGMMANTGVFGGDSRAAAAYSMSGGRTFASAFGAGLGISPGASQAMFGMLGARMSGYSAISGMAGGAGNAAVGGFLRGQGLSVRMPGMNEINQETAMDQAKIAGQERSALALSHFLQTTAGLTPEQRKKAEAALSQLGSAGTSQEIAEARNQINQTFMELSGSSTGSYISSHGGVANVAGGLSGSGLSMFQRTISGTHRKRMQGLVRKYAANNALYRKEAYGSLSGDEAADVASVVANLSATSLNELTEGKGTMEERLGRVLEGDAGRALANAGIDVGTVKRLAAEGRLTKGAILTMAAQKNAHTGTRNLVGAEDRMAKQREMISGWVKANQYGTESSWLDVSTGFLGGILGQKPVSGGAVIDLLEKQGADLTTLSMKGNMIEGTEANARAAEKAYGSGIWEAMGVKVDDYKALAKKLGTEEGNAAFMQAMEGSGLFAAAGKDGMKIATKKQSEEGRRRLAVKGGLQVLDMLGLDPEERKKIAADMGYIEGESAEDFEKREQKNISRAMTSLRDAGGGGYGALMKGITHTGSKDEDKKIRERAAMAVKTLYKYGTDAQKENILDKISTRRDALVDLQDKMRKEGKLKKGSAQDQKMTDKIGRLNDLYDNLTKGSGSGKAVDISAQTVEIRNAQVNIHQKSGE